MCLALAFPLGSRPSSAQGDSRLPPRHSSPSGRACAKCHGSGRAVTPGQPLGFPRGSRRVVVIPVRAAWRPYHGRQGAAAPGSGPARRGAWPDASPARQSDRACRAEVGRSRRCKWRKRRIRAGGGRALRVPSLPRRPLSYGTG